MVPAAMAFAALSFMKALVPSPQSMSVPARRIAATASFASG
jgi:hypothetical protein